MKLPINITRYIFMVSASLLALSSCQDDALRGLDYTVSGEDVTLTVPVALPEMEVKSRGMLSEEQLNLVNSLWVRTYSVHTLQATSEWVKLEPDSSDGEPEVHEVNIKTKSGASYIVAVANVENMGTTKDDPSTEAHLSELLEKADTWDEFLNIAVKTPTGWREVNTAPVPISMSGCYTTIKVGNPTTHPSLGDWGKTINYESVFIPASGSGTVTLSEGAIHLRRLVSHITFNVSAGEKVNITPESYTIVNVPRYTYLYERGDQKPNLGDDAESQEVAETLYYATPQQFTSQFFTTENGVSSFDFWQGENKHEALAGSGCDSYNKREREAKGADGGNTGLYTSLSGDIWTPNNMATYVVLRCLVNYKNQLNVDDDGNESAGGRPVYRDGNAEFVIHLGYLGNNAADFNCYRNVDYTYNVTVNGIDDIRVEAFGQEEYPGAEGVVSDTENQLINIDCHYAAFNIELTRDELTNVNADGIGFGYIITAWENGMEHTYEETDAVADEDRKYVEWVELRPTTSMAVLADYKPRQGDNNDGKTFTLMDAANARNWTHDDPRFSENGVYTVFVNEYTYETEADESNTSNPPKWASYVNQNARRFYIRVTRKISADGMSTYARAKYAVSQSSIVTYYSDRDFTPDVKEKDENDKEIVVIKPGTAIGVERINETEGLNLRSSLDNSNDNSLIGGVASDPNNGRYNVWLWIESKGTYNWSEFVETTKPMEMPGVASTQGGDGLPARTVSNGNPLKIPKLKNYATSIDDLSGGVVDKSNGNSPTDTDPQPESKDMDDYIEAINACMSRNRDNNGNGIIDPEEVRWYVPAAGKYLRLVLGNKALGDNSLMHYDKIKGTLNPNNRYNTRYLFFASNGRVLWGMEGLSTSRYGQYCNSPWQIRCIRNLNSNLSTITPGEKVVAAYTHDSGNRRVTMSYYDENSIRTTIYTGKGNKNEAGYMPVHMIDSDINRPYSAFEYSDLVNNSFRISVNNISNSNPCAGRAGTGWRLPNQKELAIMRNLGLFEEKDNKLNGDFAPSCTMSYFDNSGAPGGNYPYNNHFFMVTRKDGGSQIESDQLVAGYRCVRDYPQP